MNKKHLVIVCIAVAVIVIFSVFNINQVDEKLFSDTFAVSAVYFDDNNIIEISYLDNSNATVNVTLEVIGLSESFQKKYHDSTFVERISLSTPPQYGWSTMPVTFLIEHKEFGMVLLKTEISPVGEQPARVIYSRP
ncbi:MAG: hypothetical protein ACREAF_03450 [Nitrosopumilaceae archaeon]